MKEQFNIKTLSEAPDIPLGQGQAMQELASEYLTRLGVISSEADQRTPLEQLSAYQSVEAENSEPVKDTIKTRLMLIAVGFEDPGHDEVLTSIRQELQQKQAHRGQSGV